MSESLHLLRLLMHPCFSVFVIVSARLFFKGRLAQSGAVLLMDSMYCDSERGNLEAIEIISSQHRGVAIPSIYPETMKLQ